MSIKTWIDQPENDFWEIHNENGDGYVRLKGDFYYYEVVDMDNRTIIENYDPIEHLSVAKQHVEGLLGI